MGVLNRPIYDITFAHNVPVYIATRKWHVLKVTPQMATPGTESAVYDCLVVVVIVVVVVVVVAVIVIIPVIVTIITVVIIVSVININVFINTH